MESVTFTRMDRGTAEEYVFLAGIEERHKRETLADNLLDLLKRMRGPLLGYKIDRYEHSLQTATRALRDGASEEMIVAALLHDVGDVLAPDNHGASAAALLRPYVSDETAWVVEHHGLFQRYYYFHHLGGDRAARDRYIGHPHYDACARFCAEWDQMSFDPDYDSLGLEAFEPMLRRLLSRPPHVLPSDPARSADAGRKR